MPSPKRIDAISINALGFKPFQEHSSLLLHAPTFDVPLPLGIVVFSKQLECVGAKKNVLGESTETTYGLVNVLP
jgi:hypothetical protein